MKLPVIEDFLEGRSAADEMPEADRGLTGDEPVVLKHAHCPRRSISGKG